VLRGRRWEIKHDGFRIPAIRNRGPALLLTRNDYDISKRLRHITAALTALPAERFVLAEAWGSIRTENPFSSCRSTNSSSFLALLLGCIVCSILQLAYGSVVHAQAVSPIALYANHDTHLFLNVV
jgi:hypothetical protein